LDLLNEAPVTVDEVADRTASVVREKTFEMRPMSVEEAALQMEMLGHDFFFFFFFLDGDSGIQAVLYHRRDGDLGLIEPK
jgi:putative sigma-54 modulation protein